MANRGRLETWARTWKSGACNVEDTQLRSVRAVTIWATILAANAVRIERLKYLSRPEAPATLVLRPIEIETLIFLRKKDRLPVPKGAVTIAVATKWVAELGGWISQKNGPPGSITLFRGLDRLAQITRGLELARQMGTARR